MWIRRHPVRTAIYAVTLAALVLLIVNAGSIAAWVVNGPAGRAIGRQLGISWRAADLRVGWSATEIGGLRATVDGKPPVSIAADRVRIEGLRSARATGVKFGETIEVGESVIDFPGQTAHAGGIQFAGALRVAKARATLAPIHFESHGVSGFGTRIDSAKAGPVQLGKDEVLVRSIEVTGVRVTAARDADGRWNLEDAAALAPAGRQLAREGAALQASYPLLIDRLHVLLLWGIILAAIAIAAAKFLLTWGTLALRATSAGVAVLAPFLAHGFGLYVSFAAIAIAAVALFVTVYRTAPEWHQRAEPLAIDLLGPPLLTGLLFAYLYPYPPLPRLPQTVRIDHVGVNDISAGIDDGRAHFLIAVPRVAVDGVLATETTKVQRVAAPNATVAGDGWRVALFEATAAGIDISESAGSVNRIDYRGEAESDIASRQLARYPYLPVALTRPVRVAFEGNARASGPPLRFSAESSFGALGVDVSLRAEGDLEAVNVSNIRSSPASALRVAGGRARVGLAPGNALTLHLSGIAAWQVAAAAIDISTRPGHADARVRVLELPNVRIEDVLASASYSRDRLRVDTSTRNLAFRSLDGAIAGDVPVVDARLSGTWGSDVLEGEFGLSSGRFGLDRPLRFTADTRTGSLRVPDQSFAVNQTAVPRAPEKIEAELGLAARLQRGGPTAEVRVRIPRLEPDVQPLGLELNGIEIAAALQPAAARVSIDTGWNYVRYPAVPQPNRLETVDRLQLALRLKGDLLNPALFEGWTLPDIPVLPERFRVAGVWPDLDVVTESEQRFPLEGLSAAVKRLALPESRLESIDLDFALGAAAGRRLDLRSHAALSAGLSNIKVGGSFSGAPEFQLTVSPGRLDFSVPHVRPDLAQFKGGISGFNAAVRYSPGLIDDVSGSLAVDSGSLFDLEIGNAPVTAARGRLGSPAKIAFALTRDSATAAISASAFELHADTKAAGRITLDGSVDTAARLIHTSEPAPVLEALERTAVAAAPHYRLARDLIGSPPAADWRIAARQSSSDPFLRFGGDRVELRGVFEAGSFKTGDVAADLIERDGGLLIDASLPLAVEGREALFVIPVQLALREPFPEADRKGELLWNPPAVEKIWADFQPRHARAGAFLDRSSIEFGGVSLLQLLAPSEPLRVVVGIGDRLQFHAPVASRLLFGSAAAVSQAEVAWNSGTPSITARIGGGFRNLQSGAFGLASSGVHYAFLEDSFDGSFRLAANDIAVTPETLERWRLDPVSFDQFNRLDVSLQASRSKEQAGPGIVQLAFDTRLRFLNEILQQASDKIRFTVPPQLMTYRGLRASFDANQGVVQTKSPLLELSGVKVLSSELLDVNGEVRIRLGDRRGNEMPLSHLIRFAIGVVR